MVGVSSLTRFALLISYWAYQMRYKRLYLFVQSIFRDDVYLGKCYVYGVHTLNDDLKMIHNLTVVRDFRLDVLLYLFRPCMLFGL